MISTAALLLWFVILNSAAFILMWLDRRRAQRGDWRIEERTLQLAFLVGGAIGGKLAQQRLRHKTRKRPFIHVLNLLFVLNLLAYTYLVVVIGRGMI